MVGISEIWLWIFLLLLLLTFLFTLFPPRFVLWILRLLREREELRQSLADAREKLSHYRSEMLRVEAKIETIPQVLQNMDDLQTWVDLVDKLQELRERAEEIERQMREMEERLQQTR